MSPETQPLVSVGLPTYNRPEGLRRMLDSLTAQTHRNLEIVISDNASPDPAVQEVIREFTARDPRIRAFRQTENFGFYPNFRFVFEHTRSQYYMWAADDDILSPQFIEVCLANLLNPEFGAVLSFCHVHRIRADGSTFDPDSCDRVGPPTPSMLLRTFRYMYHGYNHCFYGVYRREVINEWFFARRFGGDHLALLTILRHGNIYIDPRRLFTATVGGTGFQRQNFHKYYTSDSKIMKVCVTLSSTLTWWYEFLRCIWMEPYRFREKVVLSFFTLARFSHPRYWRRFAGDMRALFTRRDIWNFKSD